MKTKISAATFVAVVICAGITFFVISGRVNAVTATLERLARNKPMVVTERWVSGAKEVSVSTERLKNADGSWAETVDEWKARHAADIAEAKDAFPPDATGG